MDTAPTKMDTAPTKMDTAPTKVDTAPTKVDTAPTKVDTAYIIRLLMAIIWRLYKLDDENWIIGGIPATLARKVAAGKAGTNKKNLHHKMAKVFNKK